MGVLIKLIDIIFLVSIIVMGVWIGSTVMKREEGIPFRVLMRDECMKVLFYLSGVSPNSPFPFSRWLVDIQPKIKEDRVHRFDLTVPSLQPNRSKTEVPVRLYVPTVYSVRKSD